MSRVGKTITVTLSDHKDPDLWHEVADELGLSAAQRKKHFQFGEYASIEITIDENLNIVGGRILPT